MSNNISRIWKSPAGYAEGIEPLFSKPNRLIKSEVVMATKEVMDLLNHAKKDAEKIILDAKSTAEEISKNAYNDGVQKGYNEVAIQLQKAKLEYESARKKAEKDAVKFAFQVAEKIIGKELLKDPSLVVSIVAKVLAQTADQKNIVVLVHSDDLSILKENRNRLLSSQSLSFEPSERVARGECIIETSDGIIDGRLSVQLAALELSLTEGDH